MDPSGLPEGESGDGAGDYNGWGPAAGREQRGTRGSSGAGVKRVEWYGVQKIRADGRCMFRALVGVAPTLVYLDSEECTLTVTKVYTHSSAR